MMFDLKIEIDSKDLESGIDGFSRGNMTIKDKYGSKSSIGSSMLIFISLTDLLINIIDLVDQSTIDQGIKKYKFRAVEGGFVFYFIRKGNKFELEDYRGLLVTQLTAPELIRSIWNGVSQFYNAYRPMVKEVDSAILDLDDTINSFKSLYSDILGLPSDIAESLVTSPKKDLLATHISQSELWIRNKIKMDKTRQCSSFFDLYLANYLLATFINVYQTDIALWLKSNSKTPLTRVVYSNKFCGYVIKDNNSFKTKRALVLLVKANTTSGYRVLTAYPILRAEYGNENDSSYVEMTTHQPMANKLHKMFCSYFHQDWMHCYNWNEAEEIDFIKPIELFKQEASIEDLALAIQQLEKLINLERSEQILDEILLGEFNCFVNPEAFGLFTQQFLSTVLNQLKKGGRYLIYEPPKTSSIY